MALALMGSTMPNRANYLDLDPTYRDVYGNPLMRMTYDFKQNDLKMQDFAMGKMTQIAQAMKSRCCVREINCPMRSISCGVNRWPRPQRHRSTMSF